MKLDAVSVRASIAVEKVAFTGVSSAISVAPEAGTVELTLGETGPEPVVKLQVNGAVSAVPPLDLTVVSSVAV